MDQHNLFSKWAIPASFSLFIVFSKQLVINAQYKLLMAGFEPTSSDVRRDRSAIVPQPLPNITIFKYYHSFGLNCKHDDGKRTKKIQKYFTQIWGIVSGVACLVCKVNFNWWNIMKSYSGCVRTSKYKYLQPRQASIIFCSKIDLLTKKPQVFTTSRTM